MDSPRKHETALHGGFAEKSVGQALDTDSTTRVVTGGKWPWQARLERQQERHRRNAHRRGSSDRKAAFTVAGSASAASGEGKPAVPATCAAAAVLDRSLLLAPGTSPQEAWVSWLAPVFAGTQSCYFTGTYSDAYGYPNGLMLVRNVHADFRRFLQSFEFDSRYIVGVEHHAYRDILHLHAILEGPMTDDQMRWVKAWWSAERGHARALPVLDGCASYVTKYALKGDTDSFEWRLQ